MSEKYLAEQFSRYGIVTAAYVDRRSSRALVFFDSVEQAQRAVNEIKNQPLKDRRLQVCSICYRTSIDRGVIDMKQCLCRSPFPMQ